jgi:alpha-ribazole phosphatase
MHTQSLFVVRHGETAANKDKKFRGWIDFPLDTHGEQEAKEIGDELSLNFKSVHSSDLQRAADTAEIISGKKPKEHAELRPWDVGDLAGEKKADHEDDIKHAVKHPDDPLPEGESLNEFRKRFRPVIRKIMADAKNQGGPVLVVAHASNIHELGTMLVGNADAFDIGPGGVLEMHPTGKTSWTGKVIKGDQNRSSKSEYEGLS